MWSTLRLLDGHIHKPLIRFLGKRLPSSKPQPLHPHPAAPPDIISRFNEILRKGHDSDPISSKASILKSTSYTSTGSTSFNEFWEAPARFWAPSRTIDDVEIQAVLSGGASLK